MKVKRFSLVILLALVLMFPTVVSAVPSTTAVSLAEALHAARSFVAHLSTSTYPDWVNAQPVSPTLYVDETGAPRSFVYSVIKQGKSVGFVTIAATKDASPYLESSAGSTPELHRAQAEQQLAGSLPKGITLGKPELLHLAALVYVAKFPVLSGKRQVDTLYYDLTRATSVKTEDLPSISVKANPGRARDSWTKVLAKNPDTFTIQYAVTRSLSSQVGNFNQNNGSNPGSDCGPTSGANIIQYWHNTSYPSLQDITTFGGQQGFIDHMRNDMGSWFFGTTVGWYVNGMQLHLNGSSVPRTASSTLSPNTSYSQLTSEIGYSRPVGIKIDSNSLGSGYYSYHWVTGVGYDVNTNVGWHGVIIHDSYSLVETIDYDTYQPYLSFVYIR